MKTFLKSQVSNGNLWELIKGLIIAGVMGLVVMYGTTGKISTKLDMLCVQFSALDEKIDKHIQNYSIHIPHGR
jgi:hypothetical protein